MKPLAPLSDDAFNQLVRRALRDLPDAPPALQDAAVALWPSAGAGLALKALAQGVVAHIAAVLTFDSWAAPAMVLGMRSMPSATRHLLFSAQGRDIDLRITPAAGLYALTGQVLGPDETGHAELALLPGGAPPVASALDALGQFVIDGLHPGRYGLTLQLGGDRIVLPPLDVGEPRA